MIRKLFAALFLALFVLLVGPLIIAESAVLSFLRPAFLEQRIIPESFDPVTEVIAEQFAKTPAEIALFKERIRLLLPRETYNEIMKTGVSILFEAFKNSSIKELTVLSLDEFKKALQRKVPALVSTMPVCEKSEELTSFRFCKPAKGLSESHMQRLLADVIEKEIPPRFNVTIPGDTIAFMQRALPLSIVLISAVLLCLISLCVWGNWGIVLRWLGISLLGLTGFIVLFIISLYRLHEFKPLFTDVSVAEWKLFSFFMNYPVRNLMVWSLMLGLVGVAGIITSISLALHNKKKA